MRKIFLPKSVANMLVDWKAEQDEMKEILGDEYMDYNLVMASTFGLPLGDGAIRGPLTKLIEDYNLPHDECGFLPRQGRPQFPRPVR